MVLMLYGIGLVLLIEGLVYALAPSLIDRVFLMLKEMPLSQRRLSGLCCALLGAMLLWALKMFG